VYSELLGNNREVRDEKCNKMERPHEEGKGGERNERKMTRRRKV
jgi:hypothetical protein